MASESKEPRGNESVTEKENEEVDRLETERTGRVSRYSLCFIRNSPYLAMTNEIFVPADKHRHKPVAIEMVFNVENYDASTNARYVTSRPIMKEYVLSYAKFQVNKLAVSD